MKQEDRLKESIKTERLFGKMAESVSSLKLELKQAINGMRNEEWEVVKVCISICKHLSSLREDLLFLDKKYKIIKKKK